jgi:hypothetical protein
MGDGVTTRLLLVIITVYRLIPCRVRRIWSLGSSSSHLALAAARNGESAARILRYAGIAGEKFGWHWLDNP